MLKSLGKFKAVEKESISPSVTGYASTRISKKKMSAKNLFTKNLRKKKKEDM